MLVVHDIDVAAAYSDRIVAMREGRLIAAGPTEDLMTPELLLKVFTSRWRCTASAGGLVAVPWS